MQHICKRKYFISSTLTGVVAVPPRWLVEPSDVSVERNRPISLNCQAQGVPTPTVVWKKATGFTFNSQLILIAFCKNYQRKIINTT